MGIVALSGLRGGLSLFVLEAFLDSNLTANLTQILLISYESSCSEIPSTS